MWPSSAGFNAALAETNRRWSVRVEVLSGTDLLARLDTVAEGSVKLDSTSVRRTLDLTFVDASGGLTPTSARDLLAPRGTEVRVSRGLRLADGTFEYIPLGVFGVIDPVINSVDGAAVVKLTGRDRADGVRRRRFTTPWRIASGTATDAAIAAIVTSRLSVPTRITATGHTVPETLYDALSDPWKAVEDLASADGLTAYFDPLGTLVIAPDEQTPTGITYAPGPASLLISSERRLSAEDTYSGVIVTGEHPDTDPVRAELWDTDPKSPTYHLGPFGKRPYGFSSPLITTTAMAQAACATLLRRVTMMRQTVTLVTVGHPGHEIGDVATLDDPRSRTHGPYAVAGATIPVRPAPMTLVMQEAWSG